jgi:hypothetical protein
MPTVPVPNFANATGVYPMLPGDVAFEDGPSVETATTGNLADLTFKNVALGAAELQMLVSQGVAAAATADAKICVVGKNSAGDVAVIGEYTLLTKTGTNRIKSTGVYLTLLTREIPIAGWSQVGFFVTTASGSAGTLRYRTF